MKKAFLLFAALFLAANAIGQTITADEMVSYVKCRNFDCFSELIMAKGFHFDSTHRDRDDENMTRYYFSSDYTFETNSKDILRNRVVYCSNNIKGEYSSLEFTIFDKAKYQLLLSKFKEMNLKYISTSDHGADVTTFYRLTTNKESQLIVSVMNLQDYIEYSFELSY